MWGLRNGQPSQGQTQGHADSLPTVEKHFVRQAKFGCSTSPSCRRTSLRAKMEETLASSFITVEGKEATSTRTA